MTATRYGQHKPTAQLLATFEQGGTLRPSEALATRSGKIYSYRTCLLERAPDGAWLLNLSDYSVMSGRLQRAIIRMIDTGNYSPVRTYRAVPVDTDSLVAYERLRGQEAARAGALPAPTHCPHPRGSAELQRALVAHDRAIALHTISLYGS